jgi:hypothetical protein
VHSQDSLVLVEGFHEYCFDSLKPITFLVGELNQIIQLLEEHICNKGLPNAVWDAIGESRLLSLPMAFSSKL